MSTTETGPESSIVKRTAGEAVERSRVLGDNYDRYVRTADGTIYKGKGTAEPVVGFGNVKDFGAVGDGVADDTAAIQLALDTYKGVYFPAGIYKCLTSLYLSNGHHLYGEARSIGAAVAPIVQIDSRVIGLSATPWGLRINAGSVALGQGVTIENIWIKGVASATPDYTYANFPSWGILGQTQTGGLTLRESFVSGFSINVELDDATHCLIDHCRLFGAVTKNLALFGQCADCVIRSTELIVPNEAGTADPGSILYNLGLIARNSGSYPTNIRVHDCLIDEVAKNGQTNLIATVQIDKTEDVAISDTTIYTPTNGNAGANPGGGYGIRVAANATRFNFDNLRVRPYVIDANHAPLQTIIIDAAATKGSLRNVSTLPNVGGDILDSAADTTWLNVNGITRHPRGNTAGRPSAVTAKAGAVYFDTTLSKPIWSDGAVWRLSDGTAA